MRETVTPGGAVAGGNPPRVPMSTSFLAQWINIALKQEAIAREDRERANAAGEDRQRWIEAVQDELQASMVAISASAHAIDALYGTTRDLIDLPPGDSRALDGEPHTARRSNTRNAEVRLRAKAPRGEMGRRVLVAV